MNVHTMKALLSREWRWNRVLVIEASVIFLFPYVIALVILAWPWKNNLSNEQDVATVLVGAAASSYVFSQLSLTCLGGNAMAGERSDRSAEFLAYLPVSKRQRLVAKLLYIGINAALVWGINWLVIGSLSSQSNMNIQDHLDMAKMVAAGSFAAFGIAWLVSSFQSSSTFAIGAGIMAPVVVGLSLSLTAGALRLQVDARAQLFEVAFPISTIVLGALGFGGGAWYFLKRVEP